MKIERVTLRHMALPLKHAFETSGSRDTENHFIIVEVEAGGVIGYGEVVADDNPYYCEETIGTCWHMLTDFLIPQAFQKEFSHPSEVTGWFKKVRRNKMAKSGLEGAIWDLWCKVNGVPLARALGGTKERIEVGVSVGIDEIPTTLGFIEGYLAEGYRRIKVKIKPGHDVRLVSAIRDRFGDIPLMADANSAYTLADLPMLKELDQFKLLMIEQPLGHDDIIDHAQVQQQLQTPICLDESIHSPDDARKALAIGACRIINIKVGRVGGLQEAIALHDLCQAHGVPVWCGGMLESGIGRAHNIAITSLSNFCIPGDTSPSHRYWAEDIIEPAVTMSPDGTIKVPDGPGIGYAPAPDRFPKYTLRTETFRV
jgi:o-succinylbenzoate synthase